MRVRLCLAMPLLLGCENADIRGSSSPSPDGRTYLIVDDDNGGQCGGLYVDGKRWTHPVGSPGRVTPGDHVIACGSGLTIHVDSGQTYRFDYWGP